MGRLKTGTPPHSQRKNDRLLGMRKAAGRQPPIPFSHFTEKLHQHQLPCWITYTNEKTHEIIRKNLDRSPLYSGVIKSKGPRYCPSIEDKVVKFPDRVRHTIFFRTGGLRDRGNLCEWHFHQPPRGCPGGDRSLHPRPGASRDHATGVCRRIRLLPPHPVPSPPWKPSWWRDFISPARSMGPPVTKKRPPKAWWRESMRC